MSYVDGVITSVPNANREAFRECAQSMAALFGQYGATRVVDCWGDDVPKGKLTDLYMAVKATPDETVCFSWVEWPSKAARDDGWARAMKDPRMQPGAMTMPFDTKRMIFGGFETVNDDRVPLQAAPAGDWELSITRLIDVPRAKLWRCWTEPELLKQWFCPKPWYVSVAELDVRPGGFSRITMNGPNGESHPNDGVYLEVVPNERLVFTDAFSAGWKPSGKAFMTGVVEFSDEGGKTRYTARARHWTREDMVVHDKMGFTAGWNAVADQMTALAKTL